MVHLMQPMQFTVDTCFNYLYYHPHIRQILLGQREVKNLAFDRGTIETGQIQ